MKKYLSVVLGALLLVGFAMRVHAGQAAKPSANGHIVKAKIRYTGSGNVDEKHKIFVFLFNSPDFVNGGSPPVASETMTTKEATVTFSDLADPTVYAAVIFDPTGGYDGQSPPPSGSSTALYSKTPGVPEPIKIDPDKAVEISITFDDSHKMN